MNKCFSNEWGFGMGNIGGAVLMGDIDAVLAELDHEGELAEVGLVVLVDEADELHLGVSELSLAEDASAGEGVG